MTDTRTIELTARDLNILKDKIKNEVSKQEQQGYVLQRSFIYPSGKPPTATITFILDPDANA